ncbi:MFS transporter [Aggregicoccus sp. 17bor-14]|uniref:MFS transporter n=1 Tax=Myxococcaceae TaxID=31 RepID=UPI00129CF5F5|nr:MULTISPECIES: MFS transporter [Myxococcaceae]MBF5044639.1 MFS transporter [Simulacricoccus sp. 17bor-14]MRI90383.1 MFS transporter [Aggregicoccus sp. 17bor-14]
MPRSPSERAVVFLIGAVQFVNILDFVMVTPLGPFFVKGLGVEASHIGLLAGSYTAAASVAGFVGSYFLDRFDRRRALGLAMAGLVACTAAGGLSTGLTFLVATRVLAGVFGGPATSLAYAIIADVIPVERRGRALGAVMGAFSVASVVGVPLALQAAQLGGWRLPFFSVAGLGLLVVLGAVLLLPPLRGHLAQGPRARVPLRALLGRREVQLSYTLTATAMAAGFVVIPNFPAYLAQNLGYPVTSLWKVYLFGGVVSFATLRVMGPLVDRLGSFRVGSAGTVLVVACTALLFLHYPRGLPVPLLFMAFMLAMGTRNVAYNTLTSRVPENPVRARFMSLQSAVQHLASASGAFLGSQLLTDLPDGRLGGVGRVAWVSIVLTACVAPLLLLVERRVRRLEAARAAGSGRPRS